MKDPADGPIQGIWWVPIDLDSQDPTDATRIQIQDMLDPVDDPAECI